MLPPRTLLGKRKKARQAQRSCGILPHRREHTMDHLPYHVAWPHHSGADPELLLSREWLVTNGLGGYASGTVAGVNTRRYHGLLVAALPAPHGRIMMFNHLSEQLRLPDATSVQLMGEQHADGTMVLYGIDALVECR